MKYSALLNICLFIFFGAIGISQNGSDSTHEHWKYILEDSGDVVAIGSNYLFTKPYQKEHFEPGFSAGNDTYLLSFNYKF